MAINSQHIKLDEIIKQTLSNYEVSSGTADWERMESLLNAIPKSNSFKYKDTLLSINESVKTMSESISIKRIRTSYVIISVSVIIGAFLIYGIVHFYKTSSNSINTTSPPVLENTAKVLIHPDSSIHGASNATNNTQPLIDTIENIIPEEISNDNSSDTDEVTPDKDNIAEKDAKDANMNEEKNSNKNNMEKDDKTFKKANTAALTDIHDSLKVNNDGLKENNLPNTTPLDNAAIFNLILQKHAADSLKEFQNRTSKDSVKVPH